MKSMSQCFRYEDRFETLEEARAELKRLNEIRHTPTQSQQPPVSPGSGEASLVRWLQNMVSLNDQLQRAADNEHDRNKFRHYVSAYESALVKALQLAQPATPPLPSGENLKSCPKCSEAVIHPRGATPYCENCGWPEKTRPESMDDVIDDLMFAVLEVVAPEGSDPEEQGQIRNALAKSLNESRLALPLPVVRDVGGTRGDGKDGL